MGHKDPWQYRSSDPFCNTATVQHPILRFSATQLGTRSARHQRRFGVEYGAPAASSVVTDGYRLQRSAIECQRGYICSFRVLRVVTHSGPQPEPRMLARSPAPCFEFFTSEAGRDVFNREGAF